MVLKYSFDYCSNNSMLQNFLAQITGESSLTYQILQNDNLIELFIEGSPEELEGFSTTLSNNLPMSIYLKQTSVDVCEVLPEESSLNIVGEKPIQPFCPKCLNTIEDKTSVFYSNPFYRCERCGQMHENTSMYWSEKNQAQLVTDYVSVIDDVAQKIAQGLKVKIQTQSGTFVFHSLTFSSDNTKVLCTNLMNLTSVFVAQKSEVVALASIEKPQMCLKINEVYKQKHNLNIQSANVRYVNDLLLYMLAKALEKYDIDFLTYDECDEYHVSLKVNWNTPSLLNIPLIKILDNNQLIMLENSQVDKKLHQMYDKFEEKNKGHFMVLLQENNLYDNSIINFYASSLDDDNVCLYSNNIGSFLDILNYELPKNMETIFDLIQHDETGKRLFDNYSNRFPENIEKAKNFDMSSLKEHSIVSLWKIIRILLGFETTVLNHAMACMLEKGPRIDYKLTSQEKIYNQQFNFIQLLRSGMSYKLAGVEDNAIALGYIESYAHFIAHIVDEVNQEVPLDGISLCGDIFSNNLISNFVHKSITKNYKIYYNKDFVIQVS